MAIWNKLRSELDRAGRVAHGALDEGKLRLEVFRARQLVDRAAQALGYAVYRSRTGLESIDEVVLARLTDAMREREVEMAALETRIRDLTGNSVPREQGAATDVPVDEHVAPTAHTAAAGAAPTDATAAESPIADSSPSVPGAAAQAPGIRSSFPL